MSGIMIVAPTQMVYRAYSMFAPSQWETALLCNNVSHWLGTSLESALVFNGIFLENEVNTMAADALVTQGAKASAAALLIL